MVPLEWGKEKQMVALTAGMRWLCSLRRQYLLISHLVFVLCMLRLKRKKSFRRHPHLYLIFLICGCEHITTVLCLVLSTIIRLEITDVFWMFVSPTTVFVSSSLLMMITMSRRRWRTDTHQYGLTD